MGANQFCLRWNNHQNNMLTVFDDLLSSELFVDVTIACEGTKIKAHKVVLSACSSFFQELFKENPCKHPIVILKDIRYVDLKAIIKFMYKGEVNISQEQLPPLLKAAETLRVKGLVEITQDQQQQVLGDNCNASSLNQEVRPPDRPPGAESYIMTPQLIPMIFQTAQPALKKQPGKVYERRICPVTTNAIITTPSEPIQNIAIGLKTPNQANKDANLPSIPISKSTEPLPLTRIPETQIKTDSAHSPNSTNEDNTTDNEYNMDSSYPVFPDSDMNNTQQSYKVNDVNDGMTVQPRDDDLIMALADAADQTNGASTSAQGDHHQGSGERLRTRTFKTKQWKDRDLVKALNLVKNEKWDIRSSAETFNIPYHTLYYHLRMSSNFKKNKEKLLHTKFPEQVNDEKIIE
ncbi:Protein bric-a-brac 2 [Nymphon striatum]|nr:Protein bric-a-brac 2 [Nymphon striatum]